MKNSTKLKLIKQFVSGNSQIKSMSILIQKKDGTILVDESKGELDKNKTFVLASISKLFTDTVIFNLIDEGVLSYDTTLSELLPKEEIVNLHVLDGVDYGPNISIRHLLDQTSGLPDYETDILPDGTVLIDKILKKDEKIDYQQSLQLTKSLKPKFAPGANNSSYYSNMNAEILGRIAEIKTGKKLEELFTEYIINPLDLKNTFVPQADSHYQPFYNNNEALYLPEYTRGGVASGGVISTNEELMKFIRAFFEGKLFESSHIKNPQFRQIQWFPIKYGSGMMQSKMSRLMSPLFPAPEIIGHSGLTGSFAFYCPEKEVYITGTINQLAMKPYSIIYLYLNAI